MSLTENDRVMVYGNKSERLPTLSELSEYMTSTATPIAATNVNIDNSAYLGTLQEFVSLMIEEINSLDARIQALESLISAPAE